MPNEEKQAVMQGKPSERPDEAMDREPDEAPAEVSGEADEPAAGSQGDGPEETPAVDVDVELARHRDAMLRMQAEMENLRKRLERDLERSRRFALERIMKDLLQVRDSMERGLEVPEEGTTVEALREGQELTYKMLVKVMQDHGLEVIDPQGQPFDPELHEAVTVMPAPGAEPNTVVEVLQKGFRLHDRLIRPAMVVVSG
jgi:molecular chaperone GrpE